MNSFQHNRRKPSAGFTLVELVVVLAIIVVLASLSSLALKALSGSNSLTAAGDMVTGLFAFARQEAIGKDTLSAVVILTDTTQGDATYRAFSVWEYSTSLSAWQQATKWKTLPEGTIVDYGSSGAYSSYLTADSTAVNPALTAVTFLGTSTTSYVYHVFLPSGRMYSSGTTPYSLTLTEGSYGTTATPTYTHPKSGGTPPYYDYVQYYFNLLTGEAKVVRP